MDFSPWCRQTINPFAIAKLNFLSFFIFLILKRQGNLSTWELRRTTRLTESTAQTGIRCSVELESGAPSFVVRWCSLCCLGQVPHKANWERKMCLHTLTKNDWSQGIPGCQGPAMKLPFFLWGLMDGLLSPQGQTLSSVLSGRTLLRSEAGAMVLLTCFTSLGKSFIFLFVLPKSVTIALGFCCFWNQFT